MADLRPCETCGNDEDWHAAHEPMHPYEPVAAERTPKAEGGRQDPLEGKRERRQSAGPFGGNVPVKPRGGAEYRQRAVPTDPALRMLLVHKGVVTAEEVETADAQLRAIMAIPAEQFAEVLAAANGGNAS